MKTTLGGTDVNLVLKGDTSLTVHLGGIDAVAQVKLSHTLTMQGTQFQNAISNNVTILSATKDTLTIQADMSFSIVSSMTLKLLNIKTELYDASGVYIGYSLIEEFFVSPGYNKFSNIIVVIDRNDSNAANVANYLSSYMNGIDQEIRIYGAVPIGDESESVVNYVLDQIVVCEGGTEGDQVVAGIITEDTQQGWTVEVNGNDVEIRGAYSTIRNPLDVDIRILFLETDLYLSVEYFFCIIFFSCFFCLKIPHAKQQKNKKTLQHLLFPRLGWPSNRVKSSV